MINLAIPASAIHIIQIEVEHAIVLWCTLYPSIQRREQPFERRASMYYQRQRGFSVSEESETCGRLGVAVSAKAI